MSSSSPSVSIECDGENCRAYEECYLTALAGGCFDERNVPSELRRLGWTVDGDTHYCPDCSALKAEGTKP